MNCKRILVALTFASSLAVAGVKSFKEPVLLTSCGQSVDALSMKILLQRDSIQFEYLPQATVEKLAGKGSIIIVLGGSSKGLGAAKISAENEVKRVTELLETASEQDLPVLAVHLGGQARRGALSDQFNTLGANHSDRLVVVKGGDEDKFFTTIAEERKIGIDIAANVLAVDSLIRPLFRP